MFSRLKKKFEKLAIEPKATPPRCPTCNNLDPKGHRATEQDSRGPAKLNLALKYDLVDRAADGGCQYCHLLRRISCHFLPKDSQDGEIVERELQLTLKEMGPALLELSGMRKSVLEDAIRTQIQPGRKVIMVETMVQFYAPPGPKIPSLPSLGSIEELSTNSGSDQCYHFIEKCIKECVEEHIGLHPKVDSSPLPLRVVEIGHDNSTIRLQEYSAASPPPIARYAALSHCWGGLFPLRTMSSNLSVHCQSIPWASLPRLFQDAITITRRLGLSYIWIDSICIIQDSKPDWERESAKMAEYYENAFFTIAASQCANGLEPILSERGQPWGSIPFELHSSNNTSHTILVRRTETATGLSNIRGGAPGPLSTRCWAWQEGTLSTRILHFTRSALLWECNELYMAEDGSVPGTGYAGRLTHNLLELEDEPWTCWADAVGSYSTRKLTFGSDKLPAISGVAKKVAAHMGDRRYLAGLWGGEFLVPGLLWMGRYGVGDTEVGELLEGAGKIPSWSWAGIDGAVKYSEILVGTGFNILVEGVGVDVTLAGENPLGAVDSGWVRLRGMVVQRWFVSPNVLDNRMYLISKEKGNEEDFVTMMPDTVLVAYTTGNETETMRRGSKSEAKQGRVEGPVFCLPMGDVGRQMYGLVLGIADVIDGPTSERQYVRLGVFQAGEEDHGWFLDGAEKMEVLIV